MLVSIILLVLVAAFLAVSGVGSLRVILGAIENERAVIEKLYEKALYLQHVKSSEHDYASVIEEYKMMIPVEPGKNEIMETMYGLAGNNGINLNKIQFGEEIKGQKLIKVPITINLDGDYIDIVSFLKNIRQQKRVYSLVNINLVRAEGSSDRIYADILLNAYYEK